MGGEGLPVYFTVILYTGKKYEFDAFTAPRKVYNHGEFCPCSIIIG